MRSSNKQVKQVLHVLVKKKKKIDYTRKLETWLSDATTRFWPSLSRNIPATTLIKLHLVAKFQRYTWY